MANWQFRRKTPHKFTSLISSIGALETKISMEANSTSESDDRASNVPDELLGLIFSFLPYTHLVNAKLVCRRWLSLWSGFLTRHGALNDLQPEIEDFLENIDFSDPSKHPWRLCYHYTNQGLCKATVLGNWQLLVDFSNSKDPPIPCRYHLSLDTTPREDLVRPIPCGSSFYVKTLYLKSVSYRASTVVSSVVSSFDLLENLHIEGCRGLHSLRISSNELRRLTIIYCLQLTTLHINARKLESFRFSGGRPWFFVKGMDGPAKLVNATLDFRHGNRSKYIGSNPNLLLSCVVNVKSLTICRGTYEEIISSTYYSWCKNLKFDELEDLEWIDNFMDARRIGILLCFLHICSSLKRLSVIIDPTCNDSLPRSSGKYFQHRANASGLTHLKEVKIVGFIDSEAETLLIEAITGFASPDLIVTSMPKAVGIDISKGSQGSTKAVSNSQCCMRSNMLSVP